MGRIRVYSAEEAKQRNLENSRKAYWRYRALALEHYGKVCECCGESNIEFLAIDHINDSSEHRKNDLGVRNLTHWLFKHGFPEGFRVLCHNCNMAVRWGRVCPHQRNKAESSVIDNSS